MRRLHVRIKFKLYPVLWSIILVLSIYILIRFAMISFSEDMGQANFYQALITKFCNNMIESGASLISYTAGGEDDYYYEFPLDIFEEGISLDKFTENDSEWDIPIDDDVQHLLDRYSETEEKNGADSHAEAVAEAAESSDTVTEIEVEELNNEDGTVVEEDEDTISEDDSEVASEADADSENDKLEIYEIDTALIGLEYILTNGAVLQSQTTNVLFGDDALVSGQLQIGYLEGDIIRQAEIEGEIDSSEETVETAATAEAVKYSMDQLKDLSFLIRNFYTVDGSTTVSESLFDAEELVNKDMTMKQDNDAPQILIYHTHSQEAFADSRPGEVEDTVVGMGEYLAEILREEYDYNVIHDDTPYDTLGGENGFNVAYSMAEEGITKVLEENPTIEVVIDLHRNSGDAKTTVVDGKETAQIMLFNGLCRDLNGPITYLDNPYLQDNLAFSFQLQLKSKELYPDLFIKNYLKCYRFNMHLRPKCMLMELGTWKNTVESARNAMIPFAEILDHILKGE